ncbi:primary-amine oxidase [Nocardioides bruguierae]|uniref:primary-amine oxidase n=1 Tax=Nocardioides bruguierae TaxID=2945102 RepID=UPI00201FBC62|nr:primary-amine oxidase [Nocardioides bruguierae]MCL8026798.1 primary-amine oxidase [Nocardioides bruguierae]
MTATAHSSTASTTAPSTEHPLSMLSAAEIAATKAIVEAAGLLGEQVRFGYIGLDEAPKAELLAWQPGQPFTRCATAVLVDRATGGVTTATVDVTAGVVVSTRVVDTAAEGHGPILDEEFEDIEAILLTSDAWLAALGKRGIDPMMVRAVPLSPGNFGYEDEVGRRMCRVLAFLQLDDADLPWGHPIDGVCAYVDLTKGEVFHVDDNKVMDVPTERAQWDAEPHASPTRTDLKPIEITQPEGPSFTVTDNLVEWANWQFRFTFDAREGLVLHQIGWKDDSAPGGVRPIINRASIPEMVVPYGDPQPSRYWINYFDQGEYVFGRYTNALELGCDCLGDITYVDAEISDEQGNPRTMRNAICMHEEDYGVLWKHTDLFNGMAETRRNRRMVISFFVTIGNYDYGFYWYLYLDGTIELEAKATGIVFTSAFTGPDGFATEMAPGLGAPFHQHLFSARLDMAVDGHVNAVDEVDAVRVPVGPENPHGNAFRQQHTRLKTEQDAIRDADNLKSRTWLITNPEKNNRLGQPVGYALHPEGQPALLADPSSVIAQRGAFATHHLWVSAHEDGQRWPAGEMVNQSTGKDGLDSFVAGDRDVDGADLVVWHTFGLTHFPRPEDWPVMPVDMTGFKLKPVGFFDRNPALDVPSGTTPHCQGRG